MSKTISKTATELSLTIGRGEIRKKLGLSKSSLSNAEAAGLFPSSWHLGIKELCDRSGIECPEELFSWRKGAA